ncbi:MAG: hypothetical protein KDI11_01300 [Alphaproteobacteria bacterium]|nr:hypothetical protein [Alphaproteobacteria bacterium]
MSRISWSVWDVATLPEMEEAVSSLSAQSLSLHFSPLIPEAMLWALGLLAMALVLAKIFTVRRFPVFRALCFALFVLVLAGPSLHSEKREAVPSVVAVVLDESASQDFGRRKKRSDEALEYLQNTIKRNESLEMRLVKGPHDGALASSTNLFESLQAALADVPEGRRAGVIIISDGQIHDVPDVKSLQESYGPVHLLLTGEKNETDRQIVVTNAPAFGIVGQDIDVRFRIDDSGSIHETHAQVTLQMSDGTVRRDVARVGEEHTMSLPINRAGQNVFELFVEPLPGELTARNNRAAIDFQGVRDRLRVLLVSGKPHAGGRTWRDLLSGDPSVDLVHFTILREPDKVDATPQNEMSLIAFPFRELFELKLYDFDLIIFDRYRLNRILPDHYFRNIARYVEEGGAFLEASGPAYASEDSIYYTALRDILPGAPDGQVYEQAYTPKITALGQGHPVTRSLLWSGSSMNQDKKAPWGPWLRQIGLQNVKGDVLMDGIGQRPLLILNHVGNGRAAQIASDHIWLWSRGYEGGGPHGELLRRVVHWLMKEPELDEQLLDVRVDGHTLILRRAAFERTQDVVKMYTPDGQEEELTLTPTQNGLLEHFHRADQNGIYRFETGDGALRFAMVGEAHPPEFQNVLSSDQLLTPLLSHSRGKALWLDDTPRPRLRMVRHGPYGGADWIALQDTKAFNVVGAEEKPALALWLSLTLILALMLGTWLYEGRKR